MTPTFVLVVASGPDVGARLPLDGAPRLIGRANDAALRLTDPTVSRRHLEIFVNSGAVLIRLLPGAAPFFLDGETHSVPGDLPFPLASRLVIGSTMFSLTGEAPRTTGEGAPTEARRLLDGAGADVRGLSALYSLAEALDAAVTNEKALLDAMTAWSANIVNASGVAVIDPEAAAADPGLAALARGEIVIVPRPQGSSLFAPALSTKTAAIRFDLPLSPTDIATSVKRMLVVSARVFAPVYAARLDASVVREDNELLREQAIGSARAFLGTSKAADDVVRLLPRIAQSESTVLLRGESGSGKTFVARLIHEGSTRAREPLRVVNCAAIPENLVESALFGHERGAFTGADAARPGVFEAAGRGTVLLDEIGELPLASQAKLLRVLEDRVFERVGSTKTQPLRARVLAATNRDLDAAVQSGGFRSDLFFRVSVVSVVIPPLRCRGEDVVLLARRILADLGQSAGRRMDGFDEDALAILRRYSWPGNVRELRNAIEHALVLGEGARVTASDLPTSIRAAAPAPAAPGTIPEDYVRLPMLLEELEMLDVEAAIKACGGNRTRAAALLGISRVTLYKKLRETP